MCEKYCHRHDDFYLYFVENPCFGKAPACRAEEGGSSEVLAGKGRWDAARSWLPAGIRIYSGRLRDASALPRVRRERRSRRRVGVIYEQQWLAFVQAAPASSRSGLGPGRVSEVRAASARRCRSAARSRVLSVRLPVLRGWGPCAAPQNPATGVAMSRWPPRAGSVRRGVSRCLPRLGGCDEFKIRRQVREVRGLSRRCGGQR